MTLPIDHGTDLFSYDQRAHSNQLLPSGGSVTSTVEYDEYVVYQPPGHDSEPSSPGREGHTDNHVYHRYSEDHTAGSAMLDLAFRQSHLLDRNGNFCVSDGTDSSDGLEGRVRRITCFRRTGATAGGDHLSMTQEDLAALNLHPATLQYATRATTESRFWSTDRSRLSIILCFAESPKTPCDFLSMTYNVASRTANILVRQSWEPRRHNLDDLDEYDHRLDACTTYWAHPFIMAVVLLQVQFLRCEEAVSDNRSNVASLEEDVGNIAGFDAIDPGQRRPRRQLSNSKDGTAKGQAWGPSTMTNLMKKAQEVLKDSIKLLDTIRWVERAVKLLILAGDELSERMGSPSHYNRDLNLSVPRFGDIEREPSPFLTVPNPYVHPPPLPPTKPPSDSSSKHMESRWHEIRQYLDGLLRLSMGLETDRRMAEARCRAQIDIIFSKMAQEDNILNARMAVASSRDSSSMKALAVITAIFLPGEFLGTLFGMSMFDWLAPEDDDNAGNNGKAAATNSGEPGEDDHILSRLFWVYWTLAIPLTLFTLIVWRVWWVAQDRYFRRHLSQELSEERYWTADGKPRILDRSFIYDFFYLSVRREEKVRALEDDSDTTAVDSSGAWTGRLWRGQSSPSMNMRQRQILTLRKQSLQHRKTAVSV